MNMHDQAARLRNIIKNKNQVAEKTLQFQPFEAPVHSKSGAAPRIIAVTSGKGGVGKTNLTVNMAIALTRMGKRVLIIDADLGLANVEVLFGSTSKRTMLDLLYEGVSLGDVILEGPEGIKYISGGSGFEQLTDLLPQERIKLVNTLYFCEQLADIVLVDTGAGVGRNVIDFLVAADEVILVTTPEPTALTDAYAVVKAYSARVQQPNVRLVVNRAYDEPEGQEVLARLTSTVERFLHIPIKPLGIVYDDRNMVNAIKCQRPLLQSYPDTIAAKCIKAIALSILKGGNTKVKRGWRGFLERLIFFD